MATENRKNNNQIHFRLNDNDYEQFLLLKDKSGLTTVELMRRLINECEISEAPSIDFWDMVKQIRYLGNNMNQVAKRMNLFGLPDTEAYQRNADKVFELLEQILTATLKKGK